MPRDDLKAWGTLAVLWLSLVADTAFPLYGSSTISLYMAPALHMSRTELGAVFATRQMLMGLPAPLIAPLISRLGVRFTMVTGALALAFSTAMLASSVSNAMQFGLASGLIGLGMLCAGPLAALSWTAGGFKQHKGLAMGVLISAQPLGGFLAPQVLNAVVSNSGAWQAGWWTLFVLNLAAAALLFLFVRAPSQQLAAASVSGSVAVGAPSRDEELTFREVVRLRAFWVLLACGLGIGLGFPALTAHGVFQLTEMGYAARDATRYFGLIQLVLPAGMFAFAALGDRMQPSRLLGFAAAASSAGMAALAAGGAGGPYVCIALLGIGFGMTMGAAQVLPALLFGARTYPLVAGLLLVEASILGAVGDFGAGYLFDQFGNYRVAFYLIALFCLLGVILSPWLVMAQRSAPAAGETAAGVTGPATGSAPQ